MGFVTSIFKSASYSLTKYGKICNNFSITDYTQHLHRQNSLIKLYELAN